MLSPVSSRLPLAALPAAYRTIEPTSVSGGVQSNSKVSPAPTAVVFAPASECSMYCRVGLAVQGKVRKFEAEQSTRVFASTGENRPARVLEFPASLAVS